MIYEPPRLRYHSDRPLAGFARAMARFAKDMMTRGNSPVAVAEAARAYIELWLEEWQKDDHPHARPGRVAPASP